MRALSLRFPPATISHTLNQRIHGRFGALTLVKLCGLLLLASLGVTAYAQGSPQGKVKHVIIMIQENRTPDNLFYLDSNLVTNGANVHPAPADVKCDNSQVSLAGINLDVCFDTKHLHQDWTSMYNGGDMRGACRVRVNRDACQPDPACVAAHTCPYSYVTNSAPAHFAAALFSDRRTLRVREPYVRHQSGT